MSGLEDKTVMLKHANKGVGGETKEILTEQAIPLRNQ
jgi:hypothetical protein